MIALSNFVSDLFIYLVVVPHALSAHTHETMVANYINSYATVTDQRAHSFSIAQANEEIARIIGQ